MDSTIATPTQSAPAPPSIRAPSWWREAAWAVLAVIASGVAMWFWIARPAPADSITGPSALFEVSLNEVSNRLELSGDGQWLLGSLSGGGSNYWLRSLSDGTIQTVPNTVGRSGHFGWTADDQAFDFSGSRGISRVRLSDRSVTVLTPAPAWLPPVLGKWSRTHLVMSDARGDIWVMGAQPSTPSRLIAGDGVQRVVAGFAASDTQFLFLQAGKDPQSTGIYVASIDAPTPVRLSDQVWDHAEIAANGTLLLKRGESLYAQRLSPDGRQLAGGPVSVISSMGAAPANWSVSDNGVLAWVPSTDVRFRWYERSGAAGPLVGPPGNWGAFDLSRDGRVLVASRLSGQQSANLWTIDVARGLAERLTFAEDRDGDVSWRGDASQALVASGPTVGSTLAAFRIQPGQKPAKAYEDPLGLALDDWSSDGRWILYHQRQFNAGPRELLTVNVEGKEPARIVAQCQGGTPDQGRFSPDDRWVAYNCSESGRPEVYVVPFQREGTRVRVSVDGGVQANWRRDQREIFFLGPDGRMMAAPISVTADSIAVGPAVALFTTRLVPIFSAEQYMVSPDGQRFLLKEASESAQTLRFLINWPSRVASEFINPRP
jgi:Tol biopolymer transport system component